MRPPSAKIPSSDLSDSMILLRWKKREKSIGWGRGLRFWRRVLPFNRCDIAREPLQQWTRQDFQAVLIPFLGKLFPASHRIYPKSLLTGTRPSFLLRPPWRREFGSIPLLMIRQRISLIPTKVDQQIARHSKAKEQPKFPPTQFNDNRRTAATGYLR